MIIFPNLNQLLPIVERMRLNSDLAQHIVQSTDSILAQISLIYSMLDGLLNFCLTQLIRVRAENKLQQKVACCEFSALSRQTLSGAVPRQLHIEPSSSASSGPHSTGDGLIERPRSHGAATRKPACPRGHRVGTREPAFLRDLVLTWQGQVNERHAL